MTQKLVLFISSLLLIACVSQNEKKPEAWPSKMQEVSSSLEKLIPIIYTDSKFYDAKNKSANLKAIQKFQQAAHQVPESSAEKILGKDPIVTMQLEGLKKNLSSAVKSFESDNLKYSQYMLKSSISFCFRCHSRQHMGPEVHKFKKYNWSQLKMSPIESSELLIATRQYQEAKAILEKFIFNSGAKSTNFIMEEAIKHYFTIVLRAQNSPQEGMRFLTRLTKKKIAVPMVKDNYKVWRKSLAAWSMGTNPKSLKKVARLVEAEPLVFPATLDWRFIDLLYASTRLHAMTRASVGSKKLSKIYLQLGVVYDRLGDVGFWELPEAYFEACIRKTPHSEVAQQCYRFLERNVVLGFTGSAGTFLPNDEVVRLQELKKLSEVDKARKGKK